MTTDSSRSLRRRAASRAAGLALALSAAACASGTVAPAPGPSPSTGTPSSTGGQSPLVQTTWPVRSREHVDLWLHSYAMLTPDSNLVPYFERGYRDRIGAIRRQRGVTSKLDANRETLVARIEAQPSLGTGPQFLPFYFESWDQMRQVIELFVRANGDPRATSDRALQSYFAILAGSFQSAADRVWLRTLAESVNDESQRFYREHWLAESRASAGMVARIDSLWQRQWRPSMQRYLNNSSQPNGEIYLSLPLDGEGRTVQFSKQQNAVAVGMPEPGGDPASVLYTFAHEVAGQVANTAIEDNTTPAERRTGSTARYEQSAAVRAGALLLERTIPTAVPGYMRFYLQSAGRTAPTDPRAAFTTVFAVPDAVRDAIARQLEVILGGI